MSRVNVKVKVRKLKNVASFLFRHVTFTRVRNTLQLRGSANKSWLLNSSCKLAYSEF